MTKPTDNPADPFKKALAEATKVLANDPDMTVSYSVDPSGMTKEGVRLPQVSRRMTRDEVLLARGTADAFALRRKYHNDATAAKYAPNGTLAREIYEAMETARCEAVGARDMPGTAGNIDAKIGHEAARKGYADIAQSSDAPLPVAAGYLVRHLATGRDLPPGADNVMNLWRGFMEQQAYETLENIDHVLADQAAFARLARKVISDLGYGDQLGDDPDVDDEDPDSGDDASQEEEQQDSTGDDDSEDDTAEAAQSKAKKNSKTQAKPKCPKMICRIWRKAKKPSCPKATPRWSRRPLHPILMQTRTITSIPQILMRKSAPRIWPKRWNWNACAPI